MSIEQAIIIVGNIFDGLRFFGPFPDFETACVWAETEIDGEWLVATLEKGGTDETAI